MKQLSKYALKQLTDDERAEYEEQLNAPDPNTFTCAGGTVVITHEDEETWLIESCDNDRNPMDYGYHQTRDDCLEWVEDFIDALNEHYDEQEGAS